MISNSLDEDKLSSCNIEIKNMVAKLDLDAELNLSYLSSQFPNSSYNPERYPSLIFRPEGSSTVLITMSGILLFTGGNSMESVSEAYRQVSKELNKIGLKNIKDEDEIRIVNVVSVFDLEMELDLNCLSIELGLENIEYNPEQFPGLIYRVENGPVALIFTSGKTVITGAESTDEILDATDTVRELVSS